MDGDSLAANPLQNAARRNTEKAKAEPRRAGPALPERPIGQSGREAPGHPQSRDDNCRSDARLRNPPVAARCNRERQGRRRGHFCISRIIGPRRERPVHFELPPIESAADLKAAMAAVTSAVANGELTIREAWEFSQLLDNFIRAIDATEFATQLERLEAAQAKQACKAVDVGES